MRSERLLLVTILGAACGLHADHLPPNLISVSHPEQQIGTVVLERTVVSQLVMAYGKPIKVQNDVDAGDSSSGQREYFWDLEGCKLGVGTWFQPSNETAVTSAEVWGHRSISNCQTGQGLKLGDTMADISRIYGSRFQHGRKTIDHSLYAHIEWPNGTEADIDFDKHGRIDHISLLTSVE
jgi:hypothetical protein